MSTLVLDRILSKTTPVGDCLVFTRSLKKDGYGAIRINGIVVRAHRASYEAVNGPIPKGLVIDHLCSNPPCVNPCHLEAVTQKVNTLRSLKTITGINSRKTHCKSGHEFTENNTYRRKDRQTRECKTCRVAAMAKHTKGNKNK